jgi:hypothetical protein
MAQSTINWFCCLCSFGLFMIGLYLFVIHNHHDQTVKPALNIDSRVENVRNTAFVNVGDNTGSLFKQAYTNVSMATNITRMQTAVGRTAHVHTVVYKICPTTGGKPIPFDKFCWPLKVDMPNLVTLYKQRSFKRRRPAHQPVQGQVYF